jgi:hypothetical protein
MVHPRLRLRLLLHQLLLLHLILLLFLLQKKRSCLLKRRKVSKLSPKHLRHCLTSMKIMTVLAGLSWR